MIILTLLNLLVNTFFKVFLKYFFNHFLLHFCYTTLIILTPFFHIVNIFLKLFQKNCNLLVFNVFSTFCVVFCHTTLTILTPLFYNVNTFFEVFLHFYYFYIRYALFLNVFLVCVKYILLVFFRHTRVS